MATDTTDTIDTIDTIDAATFRFGDIVAPRTVGDAAIIGGTFTHKVTTSTEFKVLVVVERGRDWHETALGPSHWKDEPISGLIVEHPKDSKGRGRSGLSHSYPYVWDFKRWRLVRRGSPGL